MIVKPQGKSVRRITIDVDKNGQAQVKTENLELQQVIGQPGMMTAQETALILGQVLVTVIQTLNAAIAGQQRRGANGDETPKES